MLATCSHDFLLSSNVRCRVCRPTSPLRCVVLTFTGMQFSEATHQVLAAVATLHQPGLNAADRSKANGWLDQFQHSSAAWQVRLTAQPDQPIDRACLLHFSLNQACVPSCHGLQRDILSTHAGLHCYFETCRNPISSSTVRCAYTAEQTQTTASNAASRQPAKLQRCLDRVHQQLQQYSSCGPAAMHCTVSTCAVLEGLAGCPDICW